MADYITLMGAEDVRRAAHEMTSAASAMQAAASSIEWSLQRHQQFLDNWLSQLEQIMSAAPTTPTEATDAPTL